MTRERSYKNTLTQTAVYWASPTPSGYGGYTYTTPVEIDVRWEDRQELFVDKTGKESLSRSIVQVGQDVVVDGLLYLGELTDLDSGQEADPQSVRDAYKIRSFQKIPAVDGNWFMRQVWL